MSWRDGEFTDDGHFDSGDPAADAAARRAYLDRKRRLAEGWHDAGWTPQSRNLDGDAALNALERRAWLDLTELYGEIIDVEIEHQSAP